MTLTTAAWEVLSEERPPGGSCCCCCFGCECDYLPNLTMMMMCLPSRWAVLCSRGRVDYCSHRGGTHKHLMCGCELLELGSNAMRLWFSLFLWQRERSYLIATTFRVVEVRT